MTPILIAWTYLCIFCILVSSEKMELIFGKLREVCLVFYGKLDWAKKR